MRQELKVCAVHFSSNSASASQLLLSWEMRWACLPTEAPVRLSTCFYKRLKCRLIILKWLVFLPLLGFIYPLQHIPFVKLDAVQFAQEKLMSV